MSISIVIPVHNEEENIGRVIDEVRAVQPKAEIVIVDDGSTDGSAAEIKKRQSVTLVTLSNRSGQSAATHAGLLRANGDICVVMDGDGQSDPRDIDLMVQGLATADAVFGRRNKIGEPLSKKAASLVARLARRVVLGDTVKDSCGPKVMKKEHVAHLVPFDGMHRFMSVLLLHAGLTVIEVPVTHRPRQSGVSKYTIAGRGARGIHDILGVRWLLARKIQRS